MDMRWIAQTDGNMKEYRQNLGATRNKETWRRMSGRQDAETQRSVSYLMIVCLLVKINFSMSEPQFLCKNEIFPSLHCCYNMYHILQVLGMPHPGLTGI